jgi:hypothetical protein
MDTQFTKEQYDALTATQQSEYRAHRSEVETLALNEQIALEKQRAAQLRLEADERKKAEDLHTAKERLAALKDQNSRMAALNKPAGADAMPSTSRAADPGIINQVLLNQHAIAKDLENSQLRAQIDALKRQLENSKATPGMELDTTAPVVRYSQQAARTFQQPPPIRVNTYRVLETVMDRIDTFKERDRGNVRMVARAAAASLDVDLPDPVQAMIDKEVTNLAALMLNGPKYATYVSKCMDADAFGLPRPDQPKSFGTGSSQRRHSQTYRPSRGRGNRGGKK